jgi:hypothetical protein
MFRYIILRNIIVVIWSNFLETENSFLYYKVFCWLVVKNIILTRDNFSYVTKVGKDMISMSYVIA